MSGKILRDPIILLSGLVLASAVIIALCTPLIAPYDPAEVRLEQRLLAPGILGGPDPGHLLGTDAQGRDVLTRILYGVRTSLYVGVVIVLLSGLFGCLCGLIAGYRGGWADAVLMRLVDAQIAFPGLLLVIVVVGVLGGSAWAMILTISIFGWPVYARLVRGSVLQLREELFVIASVHGGANGLRVLRRHLLPSLMPIVMTQAMLELARVMLAEAGLSYLGLGIQPPGVSLGVMVAENQIYLQTGWWTVLFPGLCLSVVILSVNLLTSWLRILMDPHKRMVRFSGYVPANEEVKSR